MRITSMRPRKPERKKKERREWKEGIEERKKGKRKEGKKRKEFQIELKQMFSTDEEISFCRVGKSSAALSKIIC